MGKKIKMSQIEGFDKLESFLKTKPILLIKIANDYSMRECEAISNRFNGSPIEKEYHIIEMMNDKPKNEIEVLSVVNATEIDIEDLKKSIEESIQSLRK